MSASTQKTGGRRNLVASVAERIRERTLELEPGDRIGSLTELASELDVGIVTVQQAARVLEHEGLLAVRRGPGGGYFARRPDEASLERALSAYMRSRPVSYDEALDITSLLFTELCGAAARCDDRELKDGVSAFAAEFVSAEDSRRVAAIETAFQDHLFRMVDRPIFELLTRVTICFAAASGSSDLLLNISDRTSWLEGRRKIIAAIAAGDEALARFEADRNNRRSVLAAIRSRQSGGA